MIVAQHASRSPLPNCWAISDSAPLLPPRLLLLRPTFERQWLKARLPYDLRTLLVHTGLWCVTRGHTLQMSTQLLAT